MRRLHVFFTLLIGILLPLTFSVAEGRWNLTKFPFRAQPLESGDAKEPHLPGATPFSELVAQAVEAAKENAAKIEVLFKSRSETEVF